MKVVGAQGIDCDNLKLVFDFGGAVGGSTVVVKDIIFRESQGSAAPEPEPEVPGALDPNSDANLWKNAAIDVSYWFADNNWTQIADPEMTADVTHRWFTRIFSYRPCAPPVGHFTYT